MKTSSISSLPALPWIWIGFASGTSLLKMPMSSLPSPPSIRSGWLGSSGHRTHGSKSPYLTHGPLMIVCGALSSSDR